MPTVLKSTTFILEKQDRNSLYFVFYILAWTQHGIYENAALSLKISVTKQIVRVFYGLMFFRSMVELVHLL